MLEPYDKIFVPNTTTEVFIDSLGNATQYKLTPDDGYALHVKSYDDPILNEGTMEVIGYNEAFSHFGKSVSVNYDFSVKVADTYTYTDKNGNTLTIPIERIGAEEFYTIPSINLMNKGVEQNE